MVGGTDRIAVLTTTMDGHSLSGATCAINLQVRYQVSILKPWREWRVCGWERGTPSPPSPSLGWTPPESPPDHEISTVKGTRVADPYPRSWTQCFFFWVLTLGSEKISEPGWTSLIIFTRAPISNFTVPVKNTLMFYSGSGIWCSFDPGSMIRDKNFGSATLIDSRYGTPFFTMMRKKAD